MAGRVTQTAVTIAAQTLASEAMQQHKHSSPSVQTATINVDRFFASEFNDRCYCRDLNRFIVMKDIDLKVQCHATGMR